MSTSAKLTPAKGRRISARAAAASESRNHDGAQRARSLDDPALYINRELGLVDFQRRVLEEAQDGRNPVLERLMFLSFVGSNIDEFFMVRVAGLKRQIEKGVSETGPDGMTPAEQLRAIRAAVIRLFRSAHDCWTKELVPALDDAGIHIKNYADLTEEQRSTVNSYFQQTIFPTLTPLAFDPGRPVSAHLEPQLESRGHVARRRRRRALCARQDSRYAAATGSGKRRCKDAKPHQGCDEGADLCLAGATGDGQSRRISFPA